MDMEAVTHFKNASSVITYTDNCGTSSKDYRMEWKYE